MKLQRNSSKRLFIDLFGSITPISEYSKIEEIILKNKDIEEQVTSITGYSKNQIKEIFSKYSPRHTYISNELYQKIWDTGAQLAYTQGIAQIEVKNYMYDGLLDITPYNPIIVLHNGSIETAQAAIQPIIQALPITAVDTLPNLDNLQKPYEMVNALNNILRKNGISESDSYNVWYVTANKIRAGKAVNNITHTALIGTNPFWTGQYNNPNLEMHSWYIANSSDITRIMCTEIPDCPIDFRIEN